MAKYLPHGTTVSFNSVTLGSIVSVSTPSRSKGMAESTDSDSSYEREYIPGLRENGEIEIVFRHDPDDAGQQELETNYATDGNAAVVECVITLPSDATATGTRTYTFDAFVMNAPSGDLDLTADETAEQTVTIKVASAVTIATA